MRYYGRRASYRERVLELLVISLNTLGLRLVKLIGFKKTPDVLKPSAIREDGLTVRPKVALWTVNE